MNKEYYEETKVKSTNNLKSSIHKPQKLGKFPNFDDKKYAVDDKQHGAKDHKENQEVGKKEQKSSLLSRFLARVFTSDKTEIRSNPRAEVTHTDGSNAQGISSKVKNIKVKQIDSNKDRTSK